jgi:endoglucanase
MAGMRLRTLSACVLISGLPFALASCGSTNDPSTPDGDPRPGAGEAPSPVPGNMGALGGSGGAGSSGVAGSEGVVDIGGLDATGAGGSSADGAGTSEDHPSTDDGWSDGLASGPNGPIPLIVVDQFGYRTSATKVAVIRDPQVGYDADVDFTPSATYAVVDRATGATVKQGAPAAWNGGAVHEDSGDRAWWFDFSDVTTPGTYTVVDMATGRRSVEFEIRDDVYRSVLRHAMRTFYYQRAGQEKAAAHAGAEWADAPSHLGPGQDAEAHSWLDKTNAALARDLRGGWYDAGDFNKYTSFTTGYVITLLNAIEENPTAFDDDSGIPESGNGIPDLLDEVRWGLDWLIRMQNDDGSVLCIEGVASGSPPSSATGPSYYGPPTTAASLSAAGAFAYAGKVFAARTEPALQSFGSELQARALRAWSWAEANPQVLYYNNDDNRQPGSGGLGAGQQEMDDANRLMAKVLAAIYLFEQTGEASYRAFVEANQAALIPTWGVSQWSVTAQDALLYYSKLPGATLEVSQSIQTRFIQDVTSKDDQLPAFTTGTDPYRAPMADYTWGSNQSKPAQGRLFLMIDRYGVDGALAPRARAAAEEYLHYVHGLNPLGLVYLTNMQRAGAEHSAATVNHTWFNQGTRWDVVSPTTPGPAPGILVGGPNPSYSQDGCCADGSNCYGASEFSLCSMSLTPPLAQPAMKSYLQFNEGWPVNSWSVTENSNGYEAQYIRLLAAFAR